MTKRAKIYAVVNQKGGVGKTTTCINIGASIAAIKRKILIMDLDPQGNATTGLGIPINKRNCGSYSILLGKTNPSECILETLMPNLHIIPSSVDLSAAEMEIARAKHWQYSLKKSLSMISENYDYIFIDCPPSLGLLTVNALVAADAIIIPLQCEFFALEGLSHLLKTVALVKQNLNAGLKIEGVVLTMHDKRNNLCDQVELDARAYLKDLVYKTVIPRNVKLPEASSHGKPAVIYDMKCSGSRAYVFLAKEILEKEIAET